MLTILLTQVSEKENIMTASVWNPAGSSTNTANADNNYKHQVFTVDAGIAANGIFTLTQFAYQTGTESLLVLVNGVDQVLTTDYTETSNTIVTIPGVKLGDEVVIRALVGSTASQSAAASAAAAEAAAASIIGLNPPNLPVAINIGGTGQVTKAAAFLALAPIPSIGQVIGSLDGVNYTTVQALPAVVTPYTASVILTASTLSYALTNMASKGQSITLPNATTLNVGAIRGVVDNRGGGYSVGIRNAGGQLLLAVAPGGYATASLEDNSSSNGIWNISADKYEPGLITLDTNLSLTYLSTAVIPFVTIDTSTSIHFAMLSSGAGFAAFVVDNVNKAITTPTTVSVAANVVPQAVFLVTATTAIVFYGDGSGNSSCVIITISGGPGTYAIAVGTPVTVTTDWTSRWAGEDSINAPRILQLTAALYVCIGCTAAGTSFNAQAFSVAGAVITAGAALNFAAANTGMSTQKFVSSAVSANTALVAYGRSTPDTQFSAQVISVAGVVCTANAAVVDGNTYGNSGANTPSFCMLTASKMLMNFFDGANTIYLRTIAVAGTVPTWGTIVAIGGSNFNVAGSSYSANAATRYNTHLQTLSATTALVWFVDTATISRVQIVSEAAGVLTLNTPLYNSFSGSISTTFSMSPTGNAEFVVHVAATNAGVPYTHTLVSHGISGTTITNGQKIPYLEEASHLTPAGSPCSRLVSGDYCAQTYYGMAVYRCNGYTINKRGLIPTSAYDFGTIKTAVSSNRFVLLNAAIGTSSSAGTLALNITNMEIAI